MTQAIPDIETQMRLMRIIQEDRAIERLRREKERILSKSTLRAIVTKFKEGRIECEHFIDENSQKIIDLLEGEIQDRITHLKSIYHYDNK